MEDQNYTIKDIARMAGVSAGTVDRVLHNRGDVSPKSKAKVQKVLDEIHYQPNVFAIGLAAKKKYSFLCLIPYYIEHDYWHSVVGGIERARQELRPFNVGIDYLCYHHGDEKSYQEACLAIKEKNVDAVLISPNFREETLALTAYLQENKIAYAFVDFNMEEARALTYIGQDSYKSGYIAAKILMRNYSAGEGQELVLFLSNNKDNPAEIQMQRRLDGFMSYIAEEYNNLVIHEVILNKSDQESNQQTLDEFFRAHPKAALGVLAGITADELRFAILSDDVKTLSKAPGIGKKTAQKLILELKDKMKLEDAFELKLAHEQERAAVGAGEVSDGRQEAVEALVALGYSSADALRAVRKVTDVAPDDVEGLLKAALKNF